MERFEPKATSIPTAREAEIEYLFDMIAELAKLARRIGEVGVAIHLEAILAARRAVALRESA